MPAGSIPCRYDELKGQLGLWPIRSQAPVPLRCTIFYLTTSPQELLVRDPNARIPSQVTPLHVAYLVQQFPPEVGAGPSRVAEMCLRWIQQGVEVTVITGMPNRPQGRIYSEYRGRVFVSEEWNGIRVVRSWLYASPLGGTLRTLANNGSFMITGAWSALFRTGRPDVLIASSPPFFPHISGALAAGIREVPLVLEVRDLWPDYLVGMGVLQAGGMASKALFDLEALLFRRADEVVVVTESFRKRLRDKGVPAQRLHLIPNGVDLERYHPSPTRIPPDPPPFPEMDRGQSDSPLIAGYLGNFGAGQELFQVLEAARLLREWGHGGEFRFVLAGDGPDRDRLVRGVDDLGLDEVTVHGPIPRESTRSFYQWSDVCLVPMSPIPVLREAIPSKIFEILASGRPILGAFGGEGAAIVEQSGAGVVVPPGEPKAMAQALLNLQAMGPDKRGELGLRGPKWVAGRYDRTDLADTYLALLQKTARVNGRRESKPG